MAYKAPIWENGKSPAISAENLNNLSQAAEGAQVLYGNSAPTSSTEGAVGQFYLVVVADSDGNYPLYQCVAIKNGSYVWRDTRRIPDATTSMLGIPAPGTINSALNVLANIGNVHVWKRVQTYTDPVPEVPAGYTLGEVEENVAVTGISSSQVGLYVGDSISVDSDGNVTINNEQYHFNDPSGAINGWYGSSYSTLLAGKFCRVENSTRYTTLVSGVFYVPVGTTLVNPNNNTLTIPSLQRVTGYPYTPAIPAGTTTDYLTSTDRNAYPDESTNGSDAYYTLGAAGYLNFYYSEYDGSVTWNYSSSISVGVDGTVSLVSPSSTKMMADNTGVSAANNLKGKFVLLSAASNYTDATHGVIYYIPADATISAQVSSTTPWYIQTNKAQPVTGHAAIPANTTITYLGQLGGGARIEVGSYVGTGTYGSSNPNSLYVGTNCVKVEIRAIYSSNRIGSPFLELHPQTATETWRDLAYFRDGSLDSNSCVRIVDGVLYWYSNGVNAQGNENGVQYTYSIFKK